MMKRTVVDSTDISHCLYTFKIPFEFYLLPIIRKIPFEFYLLPIIRKTFCLHLASGASQRLPTVSPQKLELAAQVLPYQKQKSP